MKLLPAIAAATGLVISSPVSAVVGNAPALNDGVGRSVVTIVGSRGNFCSGALIAPKLVLTAGHCVQPGVDYRIVEYDRDHKPVLKPVRRVAVHPSFSVQAILAHRATADVALLEMEAPAKERVPVALGVPQSPLAAGNAFTVAGIGVAIPGDGKSGGVVRAAPLVATGKPGTLQIRLVDPATQGARPGLGGCTGDSGGPAFETQAQGQVLIGVISWSTGPNLGDGCGGMTGVTPLTLYRDWVVQIARQWGMPLGGN
ncbi:putative serine protease [Bradyrhizobium oligotrophicum S58]|uniref:Putative serine protease n=1 Tax=Bradyrhizobium oligotrophicum S58 TaxID=1245469 RepID=M4Z132_9BRAD|nr:trypsin-like serine protease [Bradyrhizobium oligotrophicum]BAM86589.1 putative serine protease [Bradyrhizobium oligotrophicum S58]